MLSVGSRATPARVSVRGVVAGASAPSLLLASIADVFSAVGDVRAEVVLEVTDLCEETVAEVLDELVAPLVADGPGGQVGVAEFVGVGVVAGRAKEARRVVEVVHAAAEAVVEAEQPAVRAVDVFDAELEFVERVALAGGQVVHTVA